MKEEVAQYQSSDIREIRCEESVPERMPAPVPEDQVRGGSTPEATVERISLQDKKYQRYSRIEKTLVNAIVG